MTDRDWADCAERCKVLARWLWRGSSRRIRINLDADDLASVGLFACYKASKHFKAELIPDGALWAFAKHAATCAMKATIRNARAQESRGIGRGDVETRSHDALVLARPRAWVEFDRVEARIDAAYVMTLLSGDDWELVRTNQMDGKTIREIALERGKSHGWVSCQKDRIFNDLRSKLMGVDDG